MSGELCFIEVAVLSIRNEYMVLITNIIYVIITIGLFTDKDEMESFHSEQYGAGS